MSERLNAEAREVPITLGEHTTTIAELINVAAGLEYNMGFGDAYLDRFPIEKTPSPREICDWLEGTEYALMVDTEEVKSLLGLMGKIRAELATAQIKAKADELGFNMMVLEVPATPAPMKPVNDEGECVICGDPVYGGGILHEDLCDECSQV